MLCAAVLAAICFWLVAIGGPRYELDAFDKTTLDARCADYP